MAMAQSRIKDLPTPIRAVHPDLPAWLAQVIERALSKAVDRRFQTADEFREALRRGLSGLADRHTRATIVHTGARRHRRARRDART